MHDPFPIPSPAFLSKAVAPVASKLSLTTLPLHAHEVIIAYALYTATQAYVSPWLSAKLFPRTYPTLNRRTKLNWDVHVVSLVQSLIISGLALWVSFGDEERNSMDWRERVWGYTGGIGIVQAFATGYFMWDLVMCMLHIGIFGPGMLAHAVSALGVFALGFRPFVNFYGPTFILYELSSPFLNVHWFCDKLNLTGSAIQFYNGILLMATFFSCRILWGSYQSIWVFYDVYRAYREGRIVPAHAALPAATTAPAADRKSEVMLYAATEDLPLWLVVSYLGANITLNALNWYWFEKMVATIRKRFDPPFGTKGVAEKNANAKAEKEKKADSGWDEQGDEVARGVNDDGTKTLELHRTEKTVRSRRKA